MRLFSKIKLLLCFFPLVITVSCSNNQSPPVHTPQHMTADYRPKKNIGVALVLGGGGAKGFAHIGVIKCLEENNIPIDLIVGTSVGSIIGSVYADKADADALYESINSINKWDVLNVSVDYSLRSFYEPFGPVSGFGIENYLYHSLSAKNIEDLKIPFVAVAADLLTQKTVVINSGPIAPAVHASSALPPVISPVFGYDGIIVDGGVTMPVPVEVARSYKPKMVIAVDITTSEKQFPIYNMYDVLNRSMNTMYYSFARSQGKAADIDIHPDLNGYEFFDDSKKEELFEIGYKIALQNIPKIKAMMLKKMPKKS